MTLESKDPIQRAIDGAVCIPVGRRDVVKGAAALSLTGASLAAVLASPGLARAAAAETTAVSLTTAGGKTVSGALALPEAGTGPGIVLIHEWWGLNDQIKSMARECAKQGYVALAVDLYGGTVATTADEAKALMGALDPEAATDALVSWVGWLQAHAAVPTGKVGTCGWCLGGGWSLNASLATPVDATVIYYGRVPGDAQVLRALKGPVLGHFAEDDGYINHAMVDPFEAALTEIGHPHELYWYQANHAFANPSGNRYDEADAKLAWSRTLEFLGRTLKA